MWWRGWASPEKNDKFGCIFTRILRFSRKTKLAKSAKIMQKFTVRPRASHRRPLNTPLSLDMAPKTLKSILFTVSSND